MAGACPSPLGSPCDSAPLSICPRRPKALQAQVAPLPGTLIRERLEGPLEAPSPPPLPGQLQALGPQSLINIYDKINRSA